MPEVLLAITQAICQKSELIPKRIWPQKQSRYSGLVATLSNAITDHQVVAWLDALQAQTAVKQAKMCTGLATKQQMP